MYVVLMAFVFGASGCASTLQIKNPVEFVGKSAGQIKFTVNMTLAEAHAALAQKERECSKPKTFLPQPFKYEVWSDLYEKSGKSSISLAMFFRNGTGGILLHSELKAVGGTTDVVVHYLTDAMQNRADFRKRWLVGGDTTCDME